MDITIFTVTTSILAATFFLNALLLVVTLTEYRYRKAINVIFGVHLLSIASWALSLLLLLFFARSEGFPTYLPGEQGYLIAKVVFIWATILFATNYWFVQAFVHERIKISVSNLLMLLLQLVALVLCVMDSVLYTEFAVQPEAFISVTPGSLGGAYSLFLLAHLTVPLFLLWHHGRNEQEQIKRGQYRILFPYYLLFLIASMTFNWILPIYFNIFNFNALGPTTSLILVTGIVFAITRYGFLDIRVIIQRGFIYSVLLGFIVLLYTGLLSLTDLLFDTKQVIDDFLSGLATSIIGIVTVPRLDRYLREKTDRFFFKGRYDYSEALHRLSGTLQSSLNMDALLDTCETELAAILRAESVRIEPKRYDSDERDLTIPIRLNNKLSGLIIVGPKRSGEPYTDEDLMLLNTFATQAATAISRVFLYQEVKRHADELELKVQERTEELQTAQENQRDMMLHISHNLQTPLAILQTKIEKLKQDSQNSADVEPLEYSLTQTSQFIHDLLRFARLEAKYEEVARETCDLSQLLTDLVEETRIIASADNIVVESTVAPNVIINTDARKIREVVMNLASNAIKYIGTPAAPTISFTLAVVNQTASITITDNGLGMEQPEVERIFDNFYRSQNTTIQKGTGLGLAITKQIVNQLGGDITVASTPGSGSTFTVTLPLS